MTIAPSGSSTNASDLLTLACWMAGDFSNHKQSFANPQLFAHIHIFFRPLPFDFFSAIGFYSEQVYDYDLWTPYRQGVHRLVDWGDRIYIENYSLKDPVLYAGAARELDILKTITPNSIERRYHCSMVFVREGEMFRGSVEPGNQCLIPRNGHQTYLISDAEVTEHTWTSLDKGMDVETHEQIWGSKAGPLRFEKQESFADELDAVSALC
ncbi:chorismate-binding protein [Komarekiella sp. 'clone 1']|uniref:Chromophore lyase CpcT/CpeT n=1 Tax=Komarekiella delphini-convector SJRDD-AB1 TaxID=2593771 RepID=A0AA40T3Q0_9NOST|nr:chromophore lyase CpcT/CpeT [Komarekiella delphini-convector]MBD6620381.1 chorismate-binding protein [Komarekiella delphini-convector SJRDD-AB1]